MSADRENPFHGGFCVDVYNGGSYVLRVFGPAKDTREPVRFAFSNVCDLMAFLSRAAGAVVNPMQPSFDFRDHMKETAHGPAS